MALKEINTEALATLRGGLVKAMIDKHLRKIVDDVKSSPELKEARKVKIEIEAVPVFENGGLSYVDYVFKVGDRCPSRAAGLRAMVQYKGGQQRVLFNEDDESNPEQMSLLPDDNDQKSGG